MISKINITIGVLMIFFGVGFADWQSLNGPPAGRADDMSMGWDPEWNYWVIYAADETHKLYKSTNEGEYWDSLPPPEYPNPNIIHPTCVITRPNDVQVVYIGKNDATPVWWSQNGGETWEPRSGTPPNNITNPLPRCFAMDPQSANRIYLGCGAEASDYSLFFSSDGGTNWYGRGTQYVNINRIDVIHEIASAESIFIATSSGIYLSTDAGANWSLRQAGDFLSICDYIDGTETRIFYAAQNIYSAGVYRSVDGTGTNWNSLGNSPHYPVDIAVQQGMPNYIYCATGYYYIYRSTDNGSSWVQINYHFCDPIIRCLIIHPSNQNTVFVGTEECLYRSNDAGNTWIEETKGFKLTDKGYDLSLALPDAIFASCDGWSTWKLENNTWTLRFAYHPGAFLTPPQPLGGHNGDVLVNDVVPSLVYVTSEVRLGGDADYICRSSDGGWTWINVTPQPLLLNRKSLALNPIYDNNVYIVGESPPQFLKSTDYGLNWELHTIYHNSEQPHFYSIDLSNSEPQAIYLGNVIYGVAKSTDGGNDWEFYSNGLPGAKINAFSVDPNIPSIIYAGTAEGIYKSTDYGETWHDLGLVQYLYITDIEIDPEEPTIVYTICKQDESATTSYVICSVDRGRVGFYAGQGLPDITYDIEIDRHYPEAAYCTTNRGVYTYTPDFNKHLVSSSIEATFANNGRKLLHVYATNEMWSVYESGGVIYAVHSTDNGETWSRKMEIGEGYTPAIAIRDVPDYPPCVVWLAKNEQDTIYFAQYIGGEKWSDPVPIVVSQSGIDFSPPSFVIGDYNIGHLVYSDGSDCYYVSFNVYNPPNPSTPELIGSGINPCIGFMGDAQYPQLHVVLEDNGVIYYSTRISGNWTREIVSTDEYITISNSQHPSLVVEGSVVYVVWDGDLENMKNIFWRHLTYIEHGAEWSWIWPVCWTENLSEYPVLTTGYFCSWVEQEGTDYEIYYAHYDWMLWTWRDQTNISNSPDKYSRYSHLAYKQTEQGTNVYFIWTENSQPPFDIKFASISIGGGGGGGGGESGGLPFYIAKGGEAEPSPFSLRRQGYVQYGNMPYQKVDIDNQYVEYQFDNLNPECVYGLAACVYQHGYSNLPLIVKVDNQTIGAINLPPDTLIIRKHQVPRSLYADSMIKIKVSGNPAISALLVLYEYEKERAGGGPQGAGALPFNANKLMLHIFPNPAQEKLGIEYMLPEEKNINISLFDVPGRLIKEIVDEKQIGGKHCRVCDITDLAQGIYFVCVETDKETITEKVIMLK